MGARFPLVVVVAGLLLQLASVSGGGGGSGGLESLLGSHPGSLLESLLSSTAHFHSEDPDLEDSTSHSSHTLATQLLTNYLQAAWSQVPEEWSGPVEEALRLLGGQATLLQDPVFRRKWLDSLAGYVTSWYRRTAKPYLAAKGGGLERRLGDGAESWLQIQLGLAPAITAPYVRPAATYISGVVEGLGDGGPELEGRIKQALEEGLLGPVLRVLAAHSFAAARPPCDLYLLCHINTEARRPNSTLEPPVTRLASLVSAWFLSGQTGTPFLELMSAAIEPSNCQARYPPSPECLEFHPQDAAAASQYIHNEL